MTRTDEKLRPAFRAAIEILRNSPVPAEVYAKTQADELACKMAAEIGARG
jgi:hypothetical protein